MTHRHPTRTIHRTRLRRRRVAALLVVAAATVAALVPQLPGSSPSTASSSSTAAPPVAAPRPAERAQRADDVPAGMAGLDADLRAALRDAAEEAAYDGVVFVVESGRRSPDHQQRLLEEAVARYGSEAEAARWVAPPDRSPHVSGDAVDVGPANARAWLAEFGVDFGLCQIYGNEPWHFELRPEAIHGGCPPMYPDPTHDPRMHPR